METGSSATDGSTLWVAGTVGAGSVLEAGAGVGAGTSVVWVVSTGAVVASELGDSPLLCVLWTEGSALGAAKLGPAESGMDRAATTAMDSALDRRVREAGMDSPE
ncbi:hypothetical protein CIK84_05925 [Glutamicibacter arilaitensis]|uniref:Uncharacterized protein n=1 Tax=Glutamicibacter arilaitensis TaxID=256701 RepID=A0A2N7S4P0_9MICC|nr:hypothetical protein CIK84_05925 [Glutamicibacter arilaitensis]